MINSQRIEKLILADTRKIADDILSQIHGGGQAYTGDFYRVNRSQCVLLAYAFVVVTLCIILMVRPTIVMEQGLHPSGH